jgi:hypothetical protein
LGLWRSRNVPARPLGLATKAGLERNRANDDPLSGATSPRVRSPWSSTAPTSTCSAASGHRQSARRRSRDTGHHRRSAARVGRRGGFLLRTARDTAAHRHRSSPSTVLRPATSLPTRLRRRVRCGYANAEVIRPLVGQPVECVMSGVCWRSTRVAIAVATSGQLVVRHSDGVVLYGHASSCLSPLLMSSDERDGASRYDRSVVAPSR